MRTNNDHMILWKKYASSREHSIREQLIIEYSHLVKFVAGRLSIYFGSNVEYDDLVGFGVLGLIDAIDKFDLSKGVKFETYASLRIRGAIIDSIREMDWVPRSLRQKSKELERAYWELENELGHSATDKQVAERLGISMEKFNKLINDVNLTSIVSLDEFLEQNFEASTGNSNSNKEERPEGYIEIVERRDTLAKVIDTLPEKEKTVISLYYYEELTLKEISSILGVSESRISQLHTKAIFRMNGKLARHKATLM